MTKKELEIINHFCYLVEILTKFLSYSNYGGIKKAYIESTKIRIEQIDVWMKQIRKISDNK